MDLSRLKPNTARKTAQRVGRGGKRGTTSGKGTKGQKSRAGAGVKPGFRGGDNRLWQLFPKQRGASKKPGSKRIHVKHRFWQLRKAQPAGLNLNAFNKFENGQTVTPAMLFETGVVKNPKAKKVKVLGSGELTKKLVFEGFAFTKSAKEKIAKAGGTIK